MDDFYEIMAYGLLAILSLGIVATWCSMVVAYVEGRRSNEVALSIGYLVAIAIPPGLFVAYLVAYYGS